jgi:hypothetical protein
MEEAKNDRVVAVARGIEDADTRERRPHFEALDVWMGRWLNDGYTINDDSSRGASITTSDVYEWTPGASSFDTRVTDVLAKST